MVIATAPSPLRRRADLELMLRISHRRARASDLPDIAVLLGSMLRGPYPGPQFDPTPSTQRTPPRRLHVAAGLARALQPRAMRACAERSFMGRTGLEPVTSGLSS